MSSPIKKYNFANVTLSMFENQGEKNGQTFTTNSFMPQKLWKDRNGESKFSNSFKPAELFYLIQACQAALVDYYKKDYDRSSSQSNESPI